jgi:hypothetical protein
VTLRQAECGQKLHADGSLEAPGTDRSVMGLRRVLVVGTCLSHAAAPSAAGWEAALVAGAVVPMSWGMCHWIFCVVGAPGRGVPVGPVPH